MTREETMDVLATLSAVWPSHEVGDATIAAYQTILADVPHERMDAALPGLLGAARFFPTPGELLAAARPPAWADVARWGLGTCRCGKPAEVLAGGLRRCGVHAEEALGPWRGGEGETDGN
jgi:hypothetical protein